MPYPDTVGGSEENVAHRKRGRKLYCTFGSFLRLWRERSRSGFHDPLQTFRKQRGGEILPHESAGSRRLTGVGSGVLCKPVDGLLHVAGLCIDRSISEKALEVRWQYCHQTYGQGF
jgi:hypothetical protein